MSNLEERKLFAKICYEVGKMMPDNMTDHEFFAMYSQLAAHFANETTKYLYALVEKEQSENG